MWKKVIISRALISNPYLPIEQFWNFEGPSTDETVSDLQ